LHEWPSGILHFAGEGELRRGENEALSKSQTALPGNHFVLCQRFFSMSIDGILYEHDRKGFVAVCATKLASWAASAGT
jgi:hypothetical protein